MSETPWTPGPWLIKRGHGDWMRDVVAPADNNRVVVQQVDAYDAPLIAAAPEMAELLERLVETATSGGLLDNSGRGIRVVDEARVLLERIKDA